MEGSLLRPNPVPRFIHDDEVAEFKKICRRASALIRTLAWGKNPTEAAIVLGLLEKAGREL